MKEGPKHAETTSEFSDEEVLAAVSLLRSSPVDNLGVLRAADFRLAGLIWTCWLDRADRLSTFAGNTTVRELLLRTIIVGAVGIGIAWLVVGFPLAWLALSIVPVVTIWWHVQRRDWHRSCLLHILWGGVLLAEFKQRHAEAEEMSALIEKVERNIRHFTSNYGNWSGRILARRMD